MLTEPRSFSKTSFTARHREQAVEKEIVARHAANLVQNGGSILLDASSTAYYLGMVLEGRKQLRLVTNGLDVARLLAQESSNMVILSVCKPVS